MTTFWQGLCGHSLLVRFSYAGRARRSALPASAWRSPLEAPFMVPSVSRVTALTYSMSVIVVSAGLLISARIFAAVVRMIRTPAAIRLSVGTIKLAVISYHKSSALLS